MKVKSILCRMFYMTIANRLPSSYNRILGNACKIIRGICVRGFIVHAGENINIQRKVKISSKVSIGDDSGIGMNSVISGPLTIGDKVMIGEEFRVITRNHRIDRTDIPMQEQGFTEEKEVVVGNDVWIGHRVMLMPGAHVGNGCVIAAGAVVSGTIPDYAIAGGVPAKVIRYRKNCDPAKQQKKTDT